MAEEKKLSVAEILAAARKMDGGAAGDEPAASEPAAEESSVEVESSATGEATVETSPDVAAESVIWALGECGIRGSPDAAVSPASWHVIWST